MIENNIDEIKPLLWGYDFDEIKKDTSNFIIIQRVLELGTFNQLKILENAVGVEQIKDFIKKSEERNLSRRSYNYWKLYYGIQ